MLREERHLQFLFTLFLYLLRFAKYTAYSTLFNDNKKIVMIILLAGTWDQICDIGYSPLFRRFIVPKKRFIVPKVYWSEGSFIRNSGSLLRRFIVPKVHCSEIEVHCSKGSFIRNRGSYLRRFGIPKSIFSQTGKC